MLRTLRFRKIIKNLGNDQYQSTSDTALIETIIEFCQFYNLKIVKMYIKDFCTCEITVWGKKQYFLTFVKAFVNRFHTSIGDIEF